MLSYYCFRLKINSPTAIFFACLLILPNRVLFSSIFYIGISLFFHSIQNGGSFE